MPNPPRLSLISPYAGGDTLLYFLKSLNNQTLDHSEFELLLASEDEYESIRHIGASGTGFTIKSVVRKRPAGFTGHSAGLLRNAGAAVAKSSILVFIDSDCILHPDCLQAHLDIISTREDLALCGSAKELPAYNHGLLHDESVSYNEISQASLLDHRTDVPDPITPPTDDGWDYWYSVNASISRDAFIKAGGFSELGYRCHDMELAYRLFKSGVKFEFSTSCEVIHLEHPRSIIFRKEQINGLLDMGRQHPELRTFVEDRMIIYRRSLKKTIEDCESKFQKITSRLEGRRVGSAWLMPPGKCEKDIAPSLSYVPYTTKVKSDNTYFSLRLHKNCWDYSIILPNSSNVSAEPDISIIIPTYNTENTIRRAIQSVLLQTHQSFEIIVIDDASTDGTLNEMIEFQNDPRVGVFGLRYNGGLSNALNAGLLKCRAPVILQLDADDWLEANALEMILKVFDSDATIGATYGDAIVHEQNGKVTLSRGSQLLESKDFFECTLPQVPRAFRKSALFEVNGWSTSDAFSGRYYDDRLILAKISENHRVIWMPGHLYHIDETKESLSRSKPIKFASGKLAILWNQANLRRLFLSYSYNGHYLKGKFHKQTQDSPKLSWSIIIPFHRSVSQLKNCVKSWLESDLAIADAEMIIVDDGSGEQLAEISDLAPLKIKIIHSSSRNGPAWSRNAGAAVAGNEMIFFCDADHIVPPDVLSRHEKRHDGEDREAIVVGNIFGRRTFFSVDPECRSLHKKKLLDLLCFDKNFDQVASFVACGKQIDLIEPDSDGTTWELAGKYSISDQWYGDWAAIYIRYGDSLENYPFRWLRLNTGNISLRSFTFKRLGGFEDSLSSMEDWELGARAQKLGVQIISAPEAEPYHQIHPADPDREGNNRKAVQFFKVQHMDLINELFSQEDSIQPQGAELFAELLFKDATDIQSVPKPKVETNVPDGYVGNYCALTFDDGPHPLGTSLVLDLLERFAFKATFFFLGSEIEKYMDICLRAVDLGHEIGIHGWSHAPVYENTTTENYEMLSRTIESVNINLGVDVKFVRPPYGRLNASFAEAAKATGLQIVGWDVSSDDWAALSKQDIIRNVATQGVLNKIVLFHDAAGDPIITVEALEWLLCTFRTFEINSISLSDCSRYRELPSIEPMEMRKWAPDVVLPRSN